MWLSHVCSLVGTPLLLTPNPGSTRQLISPLCVSVQVPLACSSVFIPNLPASDPLLSANGLFHLSGTQALYLEFVVGIQEVGKLKLYVKILEMCIFER